MPSISIFSHSFKVLCLNFLGLCLSCDGCWYVSFGHPHSLFLNGLQYHTCFGVLVGGILRTWTKYLHLLLKTVDLIGPHIPGLTYFDLGIHL